MAGAAKVTVSGLARERKRMQEIIGRTRDLSPAMKAGSQMMTTFMDDRFKSENAPSGAKWKQLAPQTIRGRRGGSGSVLQDTGRLRNSHFAKPSARSFQFGASAKYAAFHHFGTKFIPSRKVIPVQDGGGRVKSGPSEKLWQRIADTIVNFIINGKARPK